MFLKRDGVKLFYEEAGEGGPPIVFIHGWCCDHSHFAPQFEHFRGRQRVVAVDLRGHGQSDKPEQDYTIPAFAADVAWLCGELGLRKPLLVGHSMGGVVALEVAASEPDLLSGIALLDSPVLIPAAMKEGMAPAIAAFRSPAYFETAKSFVEGMFMETDNPELRRRIVAGMTAVPQHVMASAVEGILAYDSAAALAKVIVPLLYVGSLTPPADTAALRALRPDALIAQTAGAGHFHQLEVPDQINAMLDRFLALADRLKAQT